MRALVVRPDRARILALQEAEGAFYWSACAAALLRKHQIGIAGPEPDAPAEVAVVCRAAVPTDAGRLPALVEGPVAPALLAALGLEARAMTCETVHWYDVDQRRVALLNYGSFEIRRIPRRVGERGEPYPYRGRDPRWHNATIRVQAFVPSGRWRPAAWFRADQDDTWYVGAVSDGRMIVLGAPLLDLAAFNHVIPALEAGYYRMRTTCEAYAVECWSVQCLRALAGDVQGPGARWPSGKRASLTIRHDYDRPMSDAALRRLLDFYARLGVRSTWFLRVAHPPPPEQIASLKRHGHELALHTEAGSPAAFRAEVRAFEHLAGVRPCGYTAHGGAGSAGYLGLYQQEWALEAGMLYGEILGKVNGLPFLLHTVREGIPATERLVVPNCHRSLDLGTAPEAHQLDRLLEAVPNDLAAGLQVIVMNHPDVHLEELVTLLEGLPLAQVWCATMAETARWAAAAWYGVEAAGHERCGPDEVPPLRVRSGAREPAGTSEPRACGLPLVLQEHLAIGIREWYAATGAARDARALEATVMLNTVAVPRRVDRYLEPLQAVIGSGERLRVLDAGCGFGSVALYLAARYPWLEITALDRSDRYFRVGQNAAGTLGIRNVQFVFGDIQELDGYENRFDAVIASNVLNYLTTQEALARACQRLVATLRPGGWLVIHTPHRGTLVEPFSGLPLLHLLPRRMQGRISAAFGRRGTFEDVRLPGFAELRRILKCAGAVVVSVDPAGALRRLHRKHLTMWARVGAS